MVFSIVMVALLAIPAACATRPGSDVLEVAVTQPVTGKQLTIFTATPRQREGSGYSAQPSPQLNFERFTFSVPKDHRKTKIEWPSGKPDPGRSFAVIDRTVLSREELSEFPVPAGSRGPAQTRRDILVFVHGYNYNFQESLFRLAQIAADGSLRETPILFAWPSSASFRGYVADRDAVAYSRDDLVWLMSVLARNPQVGRITVFGHSMGALLVAEALRQLRLMGKNGTVDRLDQVVLAAPDIDLDLFRRQMEVIGPLDPPLTLLVSRDDHALLISSRIGGFRMRIGRRGLGDIGLRQIAAANGIQVVDISTLSAPDLLQHNRYLGLITVFAPFRDNRSGSIAAGQTTSGPTPNT